MQMVDDTARQVDEAPSSSAARRELNASEDGVDDAGELPGGGGGGDRRPFGYSQVGNSPGQPPHRNTKSDPQKIKPFAGLCRIAPREDYEQRADPWILRMLKERVLFIGTQFSILYTFMYSPAEAATPGKWEWAKDGEAEEPVGGAGESEADRKGARRSEKAKAPEEGGLTRSSEARSL